MFTISSGSFVKRTFQVGLNFEFLVLKMSDWEVLFTNDPEEIVKTNILSYFSNKVTMNGLYNRRFDNFHKEYQ